LANAEGQTDRAWPDDGCSEVPVEIAEEPEIHDPPSIGQVSHEGVETVTAKFQASMGVDLPE
jgi:hypothetical protein